MRPVFAPNRSNASRSARARRAAKNRSVFAASIASRRIDRDRAWAREVLDTGAIPDTGARALPVNQSLEGSMARIPAVLHEHINTAFPDFVTLVGTALPDGFAQITPRGGTMVFDDEHLALWERGKGSTAANMKDGTKVTVYFRKPSLRADGTLPKGGIARFYGAARIVRSGPVYEEVWRRLVQPEKDRDPDKKGYAVLIAVDRAEDLEGLPLPG
jgi:hypothetical protein